MVKGDDIEQLELLLVEKFNKFSSDLVCLRVLVNLVGIGVELMSFVTSTASK